MKLNIVDARNWWRGDYYIVTGGFMNFSMQLVLMVKYVTKKKFDCIDMCAILVGKIEAIAYLNSLG